VIERLIASSPYLGVYLALCLGGIGFPLPEEIPIVTAGVLAHSGVMRWWLALPICAAGVLTGDLLLYGAGRRWGRGALEVPWIARFLDARRREALEASYHRHGMLIVFGARHVMGLRAAAFVMAGVVKLPLWKFLLADGTAVAYGIPLNFGIAYFFTAHLRVILNDVRRVESWLVLLLLVAAAGWFGFAAWRRGHALVHPDGPPPSDPT
jgi:membrane protein DedA with SNARE-associated domain